MWIENFATIFFFLIFFLDHLYDRGKNTKFVHIENFINHSKSGEVKPPGQTYPFLFVDALKQYESYEGYNVNIRYLFSSLLLKLYAKLY